MFDTGSLLGRQIHQFRVDEYIARGAMGMVFKAYDTILARTVALKVIPKTLEQGMSERDVASREEALKRLIMEAKAAGRLAHPNIVTIHAYGETDDLQYICMEYVSGKTLAQLLRERKSLMENEAFPIFEQILLALEAANRENIVHRDIKPANIMITGDNRVKVMDFGIAKLPTLSMTVTGMVLGTPYYMSPEQIAGRKIDIRSDVFSVGAVFYQVLTGEKPFEGESTATITYKITLVEPVPPNVLNSNVSLPMAQIVLKALSKDVDRRYRSPGEMLEDLCRLRQASASGESSVSGLDRSGPAIQETILAGKPSTSLGRGREEHPAAEEPEAWEGSPVPGDVPQPGKGSSSLGRQGEMRGKGKVFGWFSLVSTLALLGAAAWFFLVRTTPLPHPVGGSPPETRVPSVVAPPPETAPPPVQAPVALPAPTETGAPRSGPDEGLPPGQAKSGEDQTRASVNSLILEAGRQFVTNPAEAQRLFEQALSIEPDNYDCQVMLARLLTYRKDYKAAIAAYQKALKLNDKAYELHYELGCIFVSQGDYDAAIPALESSLSLGAPNKDEVLAFLGFCYKQKKNPAKARQLLTQALQINPGNQVAKSNLQSLLKPPASLPPSPRPPRPAPPTKSPPPSAPPAASSKVEGTYRVEGKNPNGARYRGTAVVKRSGNRYTVAWKIARRSYSGSGDLAGKSLTINWKDSSGNGGVIRYTLTDSGVLRGVWADGKGSETLTPLK